MRMNILIVLSIVIGLSSCESKPILKGKLTETKFDKIYLSEIKNEYYSQYLVVDSAELKDGSFEFDLKNKSSQLYLLEMDMLGGKFS